jgi:glycosyltransferase involved in cell wall biosynthesis
MRIERIVVTGDVFRTTAGEANQVGNVRWLRGELSRLYELTGFCPEIRYRRNAPDDGRAVIHDWYRLMGRTPSLEAWAATFGDTAPPALVEAMRPDYEGALVIGFELSPLMRSALGAIGAPWVDVGVGPIRFLDDLALSLRFSWTAELAHPGLVSPVQVREAVALVRARCRCHPAAADLEGACVFLAQTRHDRTLIKSGAFFADDEAVERIAQTLGGRRLVLKPHPLAPDNPLLAALQRRFAASTTDANIYSLLATAADVRFLTISSSAAIEARHFGHAAQVFHAEAHAGTHAGAGTVSSLWAHRSAAFWRAALAGILPLKPEADYEERGRPDRLRRSLGAWGWPPPGTSAAAGPRQSAVAKIRFRLQAPPAAAAEARPRTAASAAASPQAPSGVILLAPPWPRGDSANLFAAQAAAHARRGPRVLLVLTPLERGWHRPSRAAFWTDAIASMRFPGVEAVAVPCAEAGKLGSWCQWMLAGCDDAMAVSARYAATGQLPGEVAELMASARIGLVHVNHVCGMRLAQRLAGMVERAQGRRPRILLDTHAVRSDACAADAFVNPHSRRRDRQDDLLRTELALCAGADALVHLAEADFEFFSGRLPCKRHRLILPTLHAGSEAELVWRRGRERRNGAFDLVCLGSREEADLEAVQWLLREVLPLTRAGVVERTRIAGTVGDLLAEREPELFGRWRRLFVGEVPSLFDLYSEAKAVLAPAVTRARAPIRLIEALCGGKPVLATSLGVRGLPRRETGGEGIHVHDTAAGFAEAMARLADAEGPRAAMSAANAALYDRLFSNARYFAALDDVLDELAAA